MTMLYVGTLTCISQYSIMTPNLAGPMVHLGALINNKGHEPYPKDSVVDCLEIRALPFVFHHPLVMWSGGFGKYCPFQTQGSEEGILAAGNLGDIQILSLVVVLLITGRIMEQPCHRCHKLSINRHSTVLSSDIVI